MSQTIETVIFDWAGTTVDYGCFAPVGAFIRAFERLDLHPTMEETRAPMGLPKREHVARMLRGDRLHRAFAKKYGRDPSGKDVDEIYAHFEPALMETLHRYADVLPEVLDTVDRLKERGISIGSTTGYTAAMMETVVPIAKRNGYAPDSLVCPDEVGGVGRPYPYMLWRNLEKLGVRDIRRVVKVGDTQADIEEGRFAGCVSVGVLLGSSMLGLSREEVAGMDGEELEARVRQARDTYLQAGADYVISSMKELPMLIESMEKEMRK